jgi:ABC-type antimicrobial peptide transport system permease subunit
MLAGFFGALALLLTGIGLYGVTAYAVTRRRAEIGIRMALGAPEGAVRRMFVLRSLLLTGVGVTIGLGAAFGITRFLSSLLFAISPLDPITHVAMTSLLLLVAGIASYVPARRATKVDPMVSLRCE